MDQKIATSNNEIEIAGWKISCAKEPILNSEALESLGKELQMHLPEMVFGHSFLRLQHQGGVCLEFNAKDALTGVDKSAALPKVAYAQQWLQSKHSAGTLQETPTLDYDWTFSTDYKGTLSTHTDEHQEVGICSSGSEQIDLDQLKRPDPILFFCEILLFEDELADNGISTLSVKLRVMPTCFFALLRFWLRIDNVLFRFRDTRIYHKFGTNSVLREVQSKEIAFDKIAQTLPDSSHLNDPNLVATLIPQQLVYVEKNTLVINKMFLLKTSDKMFPVFQ